MTKRGAEQGFKLKQKCVDYWFGIHQICTLECIQAPKSMPSHYLAQIIHFKKVSDQNLTFLGMTLTLEGLYLAGLC